jgi:translocation and assembly module TamB
MDETPAPPRSPAPQPIARTSRVARAFVGIALLLLLALLTGGALIGWALRSETGTAWLLAHVPGLATQGVKGRLWGDFDAERIEYSLPGGRDRVTLQGLHWRGLTIDAGSAGRWARIGIDALNADRVDVQLAPAPPKTAAEPLRAPSDLGLPVELDVRSLRIGTLAATPLGERPLRDLDAAFHLGANAGHEHRIDHLRVAWDKLSASGRAQIETGGAMTLDAALQLRQTTTDATAWTATATVGGTLAAPAVQATVRAQPNAERPAQALDARATLKPFDAWPLGDLNATARALDLSAFASAAPQSALDIDATATTAGAAQAASVAATVVNGVPGRWNEGRLPVRSAKLTVAGRPDDTSAFDLQAFDAELGNQQAAGGHVSGSGRWTRARWNLDVALDAVQPAELDARAPAMRLAGPIKLAGSDLSAPDTLSIDATAQLQGRWTAAARGPQRDLQLALEGSATPLKIELRRVHAATSGARADLTGTLERDAADAPWRVGGQLALVDFDPSAWWPGPAGSAWRAGPHRLNAKGDFKLALPAETDRLATLDGLIALRGDANLKLANSVLAGVPLQGTLAFKNNGAAEPRIDLDAAGNRLQAEGHIETKGSADRWRVQLDAPALDRLAPLARLMQPLPGGLDLVGGSLNLAATASGRWPQLSTEGQLDVNALRFNTAQVQHVAARWKAGTRADAPIDAQLTVTQAALPQGKAPGPSIETLQATLTGTGRAHRLVLNGETKALPPAWTDALQAGATSGTAPAAGASPATAATGPAAATTGAKPPALVASASQSTMAAASTPRAAGATAPARAASGPTAGPGAERTLAHAEIQGGLVDLPKAPLAGWHGSVQTISLQSSKPGRAPLVSTRDVGLAVEWRDRAQVELQAGRAVLLGAGLTWSRIAWQAADAKNPMRVDADVELQPLRIGPILARLQPDFGWGGDLAVSGHARLHSAPSFSADIVVERSAGDLTVTDEIGTTTALGLTDLRVGIAAADGTWNFTQALAGKTLGVAAGAIVARSTPQAVWPASDAPLQGVLEVQVANLGTWGNWVPAGWRLDGALHASAAIAGRFGAPEYTGRIDGTALGVRNFLQGVNVTDGTVAIALQGTSARIERFDAKAGSGTVKLTGEAAFGAAPKADLHLTAERFQLLGRIDRKLVTSGDANLQLDKERIALSGRFGVDEGLIDFTRSDAPALGDDVVITHGTPAAATVANDVPASAKAPPAPPPERKVAIDLRVDLGSKLRVRGRGLDAGLAGDLHITSPEGRMAVNGTVRAVDGTYAAYGQKLQIDRGLITFNGSTDNPRLDIEATRPNTDVRVGVIVSGTTLNPRVRLFSEPDMSDVDKLSWLVMGRASDGLGRTDTALLQRAALALLSGENAGPTDKLTKAIGLDDVSLRQSDGEVKETVVALGKQISRRWYVGYERGLNATGGSWQLIYRVAQRFTLRAQAGADNAVDAIWTWRWQ